MKLLIKGGRVVDPGNSIDGINDVLIENTRILSVAKSIRESADETIDAAGKIVIPGLVDMHVHLREPGREDKETVSSGTLAALRGGVTSVLAMPNTIPAIDSPEHAALLKDIIMETANADVHMCGAITRGRGGKEMTDIAALKKRGVIAISDDGASVDDAVLLAEAMSAAQAQRVLVICHSEDKVLSAGGAMNLGPFSTRLGLRGISNESEYKRIARDIELARESRCRVHIAHVSCAESVEIIARAKAQKTAVTAETAPHYCALTEEALLDYDTNKKMNPPLRSERDRRAVLEGLRSGVIDAVASDHAPHTISEKDIEFDRSEFGVTGLETELSVMITYAVRPGVLDWTGLVRCMSWNPATILGLDRGHLGKDAAANVVIVDPEASWQVKPDRFVSKSKNSAFLGQALYGVVEYTIYNGRVVYQFNA